MHQSPPTIIGVRKCDPENNNQSNNHVSGNNRSEINCTILPPRSHPSNHQMPIQMQHNVSVATTSSAQVTQSRTDMITSMNAYSGNGQHMHSSEHNHQHQQQHQNHHQQQHSGQKPHQPLMNKFPVHLHAAITSQQPLRIKRERSPIHSVHSAMPSHMQGQHTSSPQQHQTITTVTPVTAGGQLIHPAIQLRHPIRDAAILFRVKNDGPLPGLIQAASAGSPNHMIWGSNTRINGVKPEIIGGSMPGLRPTSTTIGHGSTTLTQSQGGHMQTPARSTPTVIMGESCGVRTMVWGFESPSPTHSTPPSMQSQSPLLSVGQPGGAGPSSNNEEAAQLLLSLGQGRPGDMRPRPPTNMRSQHPLNMERLWAGDYSQLPAGQQMHALNLSSQQQWGGPLQPMKVSLGKIYA